MPTCSLHLLIDPEDLSRIQASNRAIVVAKAVNDPGIPNVIWQSFAPRANNVVSWSEEYGLYAANTRLVHGAQILPTRSLPYPVVPEHAYAFHADALFHGPTACPESPVKREFLVQNEVPPTHYPALIFGLAQSAIINDHPVPATPLNAQVVPALQAARFTPLNRVYVWLQSKVAPGTVWTQPLQAVTAVDFGRFINALTLKYDPARDLFLPYSRVKQDFSVALPNVTWSSAGRYAPPFY